jgi:hypothetical protein
MKTTLTLLIGITLWSFQSTAQYNSCASKSVITESRAESIFDTTTGTTEIIYREVEVAQKDSYGNVEGNQYDLAVDGAFTGQTIVVVQLYPFDFEGPRKALAEKGFSVYRFNGAPDPKDLKEALDKANQLWVISSTSLTLNEEHAKVMKDFYETGKGVYIWGDNDPCNADANFVANYLIGANLTGDYYGDKTLGLKTDSIQTGIRKDHLISTGIQTFYEGITISHVVDPNQLTTPLMWSTDGGVVAAMVDDQQHRLIIDGGFTRLYYKWDSAGTGRYIKNAAAWLANFERFGDEVVSDEFKKEVEK